MTWSPAAVASGSSFRCALMPPKVRSLKSNDPLRLSFAVAKGLNTVTITNASWPTASRIAFTPSRHASRPLESRGSGRDRRQSDGRSIRSDPTKR